MSNSFMSNILRQPFYDKNCDKNLILTVLYWLFYIDQFMLPILCRLLYDDQYYVDNWFWSCGPLFCCSCYVDPFMSAIFCLQKSYVNHRVILCPNFCFNFFMSTNLRHLNMFCRTFYVDVLWQIFCRTFYVDVLWQIFCLTFYVDVLCQPYHAKFRPIYVDIFHTFHLMSTSLNRHLNEMWHKILFSSNDNNHWN